jgi:hypothetical protein
MGRPAPAEAKPRNRGISWVTDLPGLYPLLFQRDRLDSRRRISTLLSHRCESTSASQYVSPPQQSRHHLHSFLSTLIAHRPFVRLSARPGHNRLPRGLPAGRERSLL